MSKKILVYDLVGIDDRRPSPFCWRAKLALAHKKLSFETEPVKFTEKHKVAFSGQEQVPVLVDGDKVVTDSWDIACYLEDQYPDRPSLFENDANRKLCRIFNHWFDELLTMTLFPLVVPDTFDAIAPEDVAYFKESRAKWLGKTREELLAERSEDDFVAWRARLQAIREQLEAASFLGGERPLFVDHIAFSIFMWARAVSPWPLISKGDAVYDWREKMFDLYDGMARRSPGYDY